MCCAVYNSNSSSLPQHHPVKSSWKSNRLICTHKPARCSSLGPLSFLPPFRHASSAGEKLDARVAIGGRYISLQEPNNDATASTSGRDPTQSQQQQPLYWESGLFDKDSWVEAHPGWARSVVTGRARLGGLPCGASVRHHLGTTGVSTSLHCDGICMSLDMFDTLMCMRKVVSTSLDCFGICMSLDMFDMLMCMRKLGELRFMHCGQGVSTCSSVRFAHCLVITYCLVVPYWLVGFNGQIVHKQKRRLSKHKPFVGCCVGVIGVETQTVMLNIPADPGMPESTERTIPQVISCFTSL